MRNERRNIRDFPGKPDWRTSPVAGGSDIRAGILVCAASLLLLCAVALPQPIVSPYFFAQHDRYMRAGETNTAPVVGLYSQWHSHPVLLSGGFPEKLPNPSHTGKKLAWRAGPERFHGTSQKNPSSGNRLLAHNFLRVGSGEWISLYQHFSGKCLYPRATCFFLRLRVDADPTLYLSA